MKNDCITVAVLLIKEKQLLSSMRFVTKTAFTSKIVRQAKRGNCLTVSTCRVLLSI